MSFGTNLASLRLKRTIAPMQSVRRAANANIIPPAAQKSAQPLTLRVGGVERNIFVFGVDNPDDPEKNFYIP